MIYFYIKNERVSYTHHYMRVMCEGM